MQKILDLSISPSSRYTKKLHKLGITLIELLIAIAIFALITAITIPMLEGFKEESGYAEWAVIFSGIRNNRSTVSRNYIGEEFLIGYWKLFLPALFESDSWIVVVGYPKDYWREGIVGFLYLVIPVVILTGLLVTISTMRQVRSRLAPLETLRDATGKIPPVILTGEYD